tara:strand:+ start:33870 stop:34913 length:1044 start_codon:yes stop_codon:yes gene_type:complete
MSGIREAVRSQAKPLIGFYAESGKGKTYSALLLARGFIGPKGRIIMAETEGGRGEAFADKDEYPEIGGYNVRPIREDFSPVEYGKAITEIEGAKPDAMIIDSASHEWEGAGGVLAMAAANQAAGKKGPLVWQKPKMDHQTHFMLRLMQTPIPLVIVCMRAKYAMKEITKPNGGKEWARSKDLSPKQSEDVLYEMFVHGWIDGDHCLHVTKFTTRALESVFLTGEPVTVDTGKRLAAHAAGKVEAPAKAETAPAKADPAPQQAQSAPEPTEFIWTSSNGRVNKFTDPKDWVTKVKSAVGRCKEGAQIDLARKNNAENLADIAKHGGVFAAAVNAINQALDAEAKRIGG